LSFIECPGRVLHIPPVGRRTIRGAIRQEEKYQRKKEAFPLASFFLLGRKRGSGITVYDGITYESLSLGSNSGSTFLF